MTADIGAKFSHSPITARGTLVERKYFHVRSNDVSVIKWTFQLIFSSRLAISPAQKCSGEIRTADSSPSRAVVQVYKFVSRKWRAELGRDISCELLGSHFASFAASWRVAARDVLWAYHSVSRLSASWVERSSQGCLVDTRSEAARRFGSAVAWQTAGGTATPQTAALAALIISRRGSTQRWQLQWTEVVAERLHKAERCPLKAVMLTLQKQ